MYSPNNSISYHHLSLQNLQQQNPLRHPHNHPQHHENPFSFDPLDTLGTASLQNPTMPNPLPLNTMNFASFMTTGTPTSAHSAHSQNTSPLSMTHVPICKGTAKHFFKLENKIALLKEVLAVNPFEDSARWRIVSENYNIWTSANQPDRYYAAVDYLPRKVREMLTNFKNSLKNDCQNDSGETAIAGSSSNVASSGKKANAAGGNDNNKNNNHEKSPTSNNKQSSMIPPNSSSSDFDEAENQELRGLLYEVYQMMTNVGKGDKQKKNSIKRLKIETPKLQSLSLSFKSPERGGKNRKRHSPTNANTSQLLQHQQRHPSDVNMSDHTMTPSQLTGFNSMENQFNFDPTEQFNTATTAGDGSSPIATASISHHETTIDSMQAQFQAFNKLLQPMMTRLDHLENKLLVIENINRNNLGLPANIIPFSDSLKPGHPPFEELPLLYTALDVESLTQEQLSTYIRYYNVTFDQPIDAITISAQKRKLACFLGILNPDNYSDYLRA